MSAARNARCKTLRAVGKVSPDYLFAALREHNEREAARRSLAPADFAARDLLKAIEAAQTQQRMLEECGADPVKTGCFDESGAPAPATDSAGRLICVTDERLGLPVWFYASRADGLAALLNPAVEALNAATFGKAELFAPGALAAMRRAIDDAKARDKAAMTGKVEP
jgi:hypothetical protein